MKLNKDIGPSTIYKLVHDNKLQRDTILSLFSFEIVQKRHKGFCCGFWFPFLVSSGNIVVKGVF